MTFRHVWFFRHLPSKIRPRWLVEDTAVCIATLFICGVADMIVDYICPASPSTQDVVESESWEACTREPCVNQGLFHASRLGNRPLMDLFISRGASLGSETLCGALIGGQLEIAKSVFTKVTETPTDFWFACAWASGKKEVVAFVQTLANPNELACYEKLTRPEPHYGLAANEARSGLTPCVVTKHTIFSATIRGALEGGHLKLAQWFQLRAPYKLSEDRETIYHAFVGGNASCIEWVQKELAQDESFWSKAFLGACFGGHAALVKMTKGHLSKPLSSKLGFRIVGALVRSSVYDMSLVRELFLEYPEMYLALQHSDYYSILLETCIAGKVDLLDFLFPKLAIKADWKELALRAAQWEQIGVLKWMKQQKLLPKSDLFVDCRLEYQVTTIRSWKGTSLHLLLWC